MAIDPEIISAFVVAVTGLALAIAGYIRSRGKPVDPAQRKAFEPRPARLALAQEDRALIREGVDAVKSMARALDEHRGEIRELGRDMRGRGP